MTGTMADRAARAGRAIVDQLRSALDPSADRPAGAGRSAEGWLSVTVLCDPQDLDAAAPLAPLADLDQEIEIRVRPAPGDKGSELSARFREPPPRADAARRLTGSDHEAPLRAALRQAKQLIEVGEVLVLDPAPHGERTATPGGALLEAATKAAPGGGVR